MDKKNKTIKMSRTWLKRLLFLVFTLLLAGFVLMDSLGVFDTRPYREVPHGDHSHFVPLDRDPVIPLSAFPTRPPREGELITPTGDFAPDSLGAWW